MSTYTEDEARGVSIGCNYSLKLMREAQLIPEEITRLADAIDFIRRNPVQDYDFEQVEALMNVAFFLGAESGLLRSFDRIRDRTFVVDNRASSPRIFRNNVIATTQFSFTQYCSEIRLKCRVHLPDSVFDGFTTDERKK